MSNAIKFLSGLLVVQILILFWLTASGGSSQGIFQTDQTLLTADFSTVDKIVIEAAEKNKEAEQVVLARKGDGWIVPAADDFPVSERKIKNDLAALFELKKSWPVGKTPIAAKQFKVADKDFMRRISFRKGDKDLQVLYLGTSPGFKKVHARLAGQDLTYSVKFGVFQVPAQAKEWFNKTLLTLEQGDIKEVKLNNLVLESKKGGLEIQGLKEGQEIDQDKLQSLINNLVGIGFEEVLGVENKEEYKQSQPVLEYQIVLADGTKLSYTVSGPLEDKFYVLKTSEYPYYFKVQKPRFDSLIASNLSSLVKEKQQEEAQAGAPQEGADGAQLPQASGTEQVAPSEAVEPGTPAAAP